LFARQNATRVATRTLHRARISISAGPVRCIPKNSGVHSALRNHCERNNFSARSWGFQPPSRHTIHAATAIITYSSVQAGPKIHDGGFQGGLRRLAYHPSVETNTALPAAPKLSASQPTNAGNSRDVSFWEAWDAFIKKGCSFGLLTAIPMPHTEARRIKAISANGLSGDAQFVAPVGQTGATAPQQVGDGCRGLAVAAAGG